MIKFIFAFFIYMFAAVQAVNGQSVYVHEIPDAEAEALRQSAHHFFERQDYLQAYENYKKVANSSLASLNDIRNYANSIHRLLKGKSENSSSYLPLFKEWGEATLRAANHPQHDIQDLRNTAGIHFSLAEYTNNLEYAKVALRFRELAMKHPNSNESDNRRYEQTKELFSKKFGISF